jgi:hypothetical protein
LAHWHDKEQIMAGTMAFYNGMMPGITKMVGSIAGDEASNRGYRQAATAEAAIAGARKDNIEAAIKQQEFGNSQQGSLNYVLGKHGIGAGEFNGYMQHMTGKRDPNAPPVNYTPEQTTKLNAALRDFGALRRGNEHNIGSYENNMAKAPGEAAESGIKQRIGQSFETGQGFGPYKSFNEVAGAGNAALGRGGADSVPTDVKTWQWLQTQPPEVRAQYQGWDHSRRAAGAAAGTTVMTPVEMLADDNKTVVYGYPSKKGGEITPTTARVPPKARNLNQIIADKVANGQTAAPPAPANPRVSGGAITPAAPTPTLIGKDRKTGKNVYEINGKRFTEE